MDESHAVGGSNRPEGLPRAVVLGGTGFVGRHLVRALSQQGWEVVVPSRHAARHRDMGLWPSVVLVDMNPPARSDLATHRGSPELAELLEGTDLLVNLVGILNERRHNGKGFERVHIKLTKAALRAAADAGVPRYLHMSALGADEEGGVSHYQRSKGKAENWVHRFGRKHDISVTSFRPSVIFGPGDSFLNRFADLAKLMPGVFPLACANARFSPVFVGDVVRHYVESLDDPKADGARYDLCGPHDYSLGELVRYAASISGHPRWVVGLPMWLSRIQARVMEWLPGKPFSRDNLDSLQRDNTCSPECPREPTRLEDVAPGYLVPGNAGPGKSAPRRG
ncbi:complex I NDUFA9 subunit family protein [Guyparkeria sp.]|uniref:complex I NDUFA9 subunit family protein n=1 Tax=Guyparkeria sp. TaxID=2035736 RepID=UPI003970A2FF